MRRTITTSTPEVKEESSTDDILNSPAFLSRKVDVLKSDISAVEEKIDAMNTVYEENKKEWGPQIEDLRKEVCSSNSCITSIIVMNDFRMIHIAAQNLSHF